MGDEATDDEDSTRHEHGTGGEAVVGGPSGHGPVVSPVVVDGNV
jgi:hypothetical protein